MKKVLLSLCVFFYFAASSQCLIKEISLQQRNSNSTLIIEGRVVSSYSFWNESRTMIYTSNRVEVLKIFKGNLSSSSIEIITEGGIVGYRMIKADPSLLLTQGETGIFMCEPVKRSRVLPQNTTGLSRFQAYASVQGFIKYDLNEGTASDAFKKYLDIENELYKTFSPALNYKIVVPFDINSIQIPASRITSISGFSPTTISAGTGSVLTINGSGFGASRGSGTVRFKDADNGGSTYINPLPSQYLSWSDNQITVQVPAGAGTGIIEITQGVTYTSAAPITISYSRSNYDYDMGFGLQAWPPDHINNNGSGGYTWQMNADFDANAPARAAFLRAFNAWRCGTDINWNLGTTTPVNSAAGDGQNVISFDNASPLDPGILGVCYSYWSGCTPDNINAVWWVEELDIIFDDESNIAPLTWEFGTSAPSGSEYDFETVAIHELGHGHQLGHVISPGAIMHYELNSGVSNRSLSANDLAGGNFVQAESETANSCGPSPMSAYTGCTILPITITSINAYYKEKGIQLEWVNASESEVHFYDIEESGNGIAFTKAASFNPKANNGLSAAYDWFDQRVHKGNNFYRIRSVGYTGETKYTPIVVVNVDKDQEAFSIYPNPVKGNSIMVELNDLEKGIYKLTLFNSAGQQVMANTIVHSGGNATENIYLKAVPAGIYSFRLQSNHYNFRQTVIIDQAR